MKLALLPQEPAVDSDEPSCLCFVHIPKTAGTALVHALADFFDPREVLGYTGSLPDSVSGLGLAAGHFNFIDFERMRGPKVYFTCLRRPVSRLVSLYRFWSSIRSADLLDVDDKVALRAQQMSFE